MAELGLGFKGEPLGEIVNAGCPLIMAPGKVGKEGEWQRTSEEPWLGVVPVRHLVSPGDLVQRPWQSRLGIRAAREARNKRNSTSGSKVLQLSSGHITLMEGLLFSCPSLSFPYVVTGTIKSPVLIQMGFSTEWKPLLLLLPICINMILDVWETLYRAASFTTVGLKPTWPTYISRPGKLLGLFLLLRQRPRALILFHPGFTHIPV